MVACGLFGQPAAAQQAPPNVVLITLDTVRADHLGCYGHKGIKTPHIDGLASDGVLFQKAYTPVPITLPAHASLFTGTYPMVTGMHDFSGNRLSPDQPTLASLLRAQGYSTAGIVGAAVLDSRFGLDSGFDYYYDEFDFSRLDEQNLDAMERPADVVTDRALAWLGQNSSKPFFLFVHLYDPHHPYLPPAPYDAEYRNNPYDGEIAFVDAQIGRIMSFLAERDLYDPTLIVLASDHGEGLGEHGEETHGLFIYTTTLQVPLIVKLPARQSVARKQVAVPVSLIDVLPTVLQLTGNAVPGHVQGKSLLPLMLGRDEKLHDGLYAESYLPRIHFNWSELRSIRVGDYHFIRAPRPELYDLSKDPGERRNLHANEKERAEVLRATLSELVKEYTPGEGAQSAEESPLDPVLSERLKSLGYVALSGGADLSIEGLDLADPKDRIKMYELVSEAMTDSQRGRYQASVTKLRTTLQWEEDSVPVRYLLGLNYYRLNDFPSAIDEFRRVLRLQPDFSLASYYLGLSYGKAGDWDQAIATLKRTLVLDSTNFSAAFNLGAAYLRVGRVPEAAAAFRQSVEINPDYAQGHGALGEILLYQKRVDEAIASLRRAIELNPEDAKGRLALAKALESKGLHQEAQEERAKAQSLLPR
jgi:arylsulfatase A-like enzyme/Flp pilus assembly protein TadD